MISSSLISSLTRRGGWDVRSGTEGRYLREERQTAEVEGKSPPSAPDHESMFDRTYCNGRASILVVVPK